MTKEDYEEIWQAIHGALRENNLGDLSERLMPDVAAATSDESEEERDFREKPEAQLMHFLELFKAEISIQSETKYQQTVERLRRHVESDQPISLQVMLTDEDQWRMGSPASRIELRPTPGMDELADDLFNLMSSLKNEIQRGYTHDNDNEFKL